jgi:hypothetical protein
LPFGHRHSLLGHPLPAGELGPPHGRLTGQRPDPDGVTAFRTHELRPGWAPSIPRGRRCSSRSIVAFGRRLPLRSGQSLHPTYFPSTGSRLTRHQRGFKQFARPVFPSPVAARMERAALGLSLGLRTPPTKSRRRTPRWEQAIEHGPGTTAQLTFVDLQSASSLNACDLASHARFPITPTKPTVAFASRGLDAPISSATTDGAHHTSRGTRPLVRWF